MRIKKEKEYVRKLPLQTCIFCKGLFIFSRECQPNMCLHCLKQSNLIHYYDINGIKKKNSRVKRKQGGEDRIVEEAPDVVEPILTIHTI